MLRTSIKIWCRPCPHSSKFIIRIQLPIDPRWMGRWRQQTKTSRKYYKRWQRLIGIDMRSSHLYFSLIELQSILPPGRPHFLSSTEWRQSCQIKVNSVIVNLDGNHNLKKLNGPEIALISWTLLKKREWQLYVMVNATKRIAQAYKYEKTIWFGRRSYLLEKTPT